MVKPSERGYLMDKQKELYQERAIEKADSILYTYKQHFAVANFYRTLSRVLDVIMFGAAALLVADTFWNVFPPHYIVIPPLVIAGITGYRRGTKLSDKSERFRQSAKQYHALFEEFRDFLAITVECEDREKVRREFEELTERRRELNKTTPDANGIWYRYIKWKGEKQLRQEVTTNSETRDAFVGNGSNSD